MFRKLALRTDLDSGIRLAGTLDTLKTAVMNALESLTFDIANQADRVSVALMDGTKAERRIADLERQVRNLEREVQDLSRNP